MTPQAMIPESLPEFHDIYSYHYPPFWQTTTFYILLSLILLVVGGFIAFLLIMKKRRQLTPEEWAFAQLEQIKSIPRESKREYQRLYFSLTSMIKEYLAKRFDWKTVDKTDEELLTFLEKQGFNKELLEKLQETLEGATRIKFANEQALKEQAQRDFETTETMVNNCKPQEKHKK